MSPRLCRWTIVLASRIVPRRTRAAWRAHWETGLDNWLMLVDRGDVTMRSSGEVCRAAIAEAWCERFDRVPFARALRGPLPAPFAAILLLATVAVLSRGFAYTRVIPQSGDRIFGHSLVLGFALVSSIVLVLFRGVRPHGGWRVAAYLTVKTTLLLVALTMLWLEGGGWLRAHIPGAPASALIGGLVWSMAFIGAFGWLAGWCFSDQCRRCPVCLRRLTSPVSIGTWSSVFEPATTELVCDEGHGLLCVSDSEADPSGNWTALDATWRGL